MKVVHSRILVDNSMQVECDMGIGKGNEHMGNASATNDGVKVAYTRFDRDWSRRSVWFSCLMCINLVAFRTDFERYDLYTFANCAMPFRKLRTATAVSVDGKCLGSTKRREAEDGAR